MPDHKPSINSGRPKDLIVGARDQASAAPPPSSGSVLPAAVCAHGPAILVSFTGVNSIFRLRFDAPLLPISPTSPDRPAAANTPLDQFFVQPSTGDRTMRMKFTVMATVFAALTCTTGTAAQ